MEENINFKILMIGDNFSGKTKLLNRYVDEYYRSDDVSTLGVDCKKKNLKINDIDVCLNLWDTTGQERYRSLSVYFVRGAEGIMFVYDITNRQSFDFIKDLVRESYYNGTNEIKQIIVGTKCEKENKRVVSKEQLENLCLKYKIEGIEVSYKTGENVSKCFEILAKSIMGNKTKKELLNLYGINKEERNKYKLLYKKKNKKENEKIKNENETLKKKFVSIDKPKNYSKILLTKYINY
jgi:Ras-related protein Rab-1A